MKPIAEHRKLDIQLKFIGFPFYEGRRNSMCDCFACTASDEDFSARMKSRSEMARVNPELLLKATERDLE